MRARLLAGFSLMEMMVVLLIVAIIAAASAPMVSKKMSRGSSGESPWVFTGLGNNIAYNMSGDANSSAIIGSSRYSRRDGNSPTNPRLVIASGNDSNHPALAFADSTGTFSGQINMNAATNVVTMNDQSVGNNSVALGLGQSITGSPSGIVAIGSGSTIGTGANNSIAIGSTAKAVGENSIALGTMSLDEYSNAAGTNRGWNTNHAIGARGIGSVSIGALSTAMHDNTTALGAWTEALETGSTALGASATAGNQWTTAVGTSAFASNQGAVALGAGSWAEGQQSIAIGNGNPNSWSKTDGTTYAGAQNAIAIGTGARALHDNSVAIGANAQTTTGNQIMLGTASDTVVIPGSLIVEGEFSVEKSAMLAGKEGYVHLREAESNSLLYRFQKRRTTTEYEMMVDGRGGSYTVCGRTYTSDRRLKNVGKKYTAGLEELKKLDFFNYTFKKDELKTPRVGVMAQDLQKVFPDAVIKGDDGYLKIRLEDMFYAVINAVKELDLRYSKMQKTIDEQQKTIDELVKRIEKLEQR